MFKWGLYRLIPHIRDIQYLIPPAFIAYLTSFGWDEEILDFTDFTKALVRNGIVYTEGPLIHLPGMFGVQKGMPCILLSSLLKEPFKSFVAFHELGHYNFDSSHLCFYANIRGREPIEARASLLAAVSKIPRPLIETMSSRDMKEVFDYPFELYAFRKAVYDVTGL